LSHIAKDVLLLFLVFWKFLAAMALYLGMVIEVSRRGRRIRRLYHHRNDILVYWQLSLSRNPVSRGCFWYTYAGYSPGNVTAILLRVVFSTEIQARLVRNLAAKKTLNFKA
jgi:hypothetical protein